LGAAFWRLWWATGISSSGDGLVNVAVPLLTLTLTRSPLVIAGVTAANRAAAAAATLPAGVLADRVDRRRLMVGCNLVAGVALAGLVVAMTAGALHLVEVYVISAVLAVCDTAYVLAAQASVPVIVPDEQLAKANGRLQAVGGAGEQFLGPGSGGFLFAVASRLPFIGDSISFFISAVLVRRSLPRGPAMRAARPAVAGSSEPRGSDAGWAADFRQGLRWFKAERRVQVLAATVASLTFTQNMVFAILVVYGTRSLHLGSTGYGLFVALPSLLGVAGAFAAGAIVQRFGAGRVIVGGVGAAIVSYVGLGLTHVAVLAVFVFGLQELGTAVANVGSITTRQRLIPRHLYGRVAGAYRLMIAAAVPVGALLGGFIAELTNASRTMLVAGGLELVMLAFLAPVLLRTLASNPLPAGDHVPAGDG
jgi:MFS family permease